MKNLLQRAFVTAAVACVLASAARGQQLINNGGFETGFTGWTRSSQIGSDGDWFVQSGTMSPVNGFAVPAPPGGTNAAMTDAQGSGTRVMYQDFVVPFTLGVTTLSFDLYIQNHASAFFSPNTLDFATPALNQQFRVDIMTTGADPFSVTVGDVLMAVYQTQPGDPLTSGYTRITVDLSSLFATHMGETLRLRFAQADNVNFLVVGVDNVSLVVPEPGTISLLIAALGLLGGAILTKRRPS